MRAGLKALVMVGLYKLKALGTALIIKAIYGKLTPIGQVRLLTEILDDFRRFVDEIWRF